MSSRGASLVALATLVLGGCGISVLVQKDPMRDALAGLTPGTNSRADVVALLGEPFVSFPERGVDVFQRAGSLVDVLLPGIPYETEFTYYTLISHDASGRLTGIDGGGYVYRSKLEADRFRYRMD